MTTLRRATLRTGLTGDRRVAATLLTGNMARAVLGFVTAAAAARLLGADGRGRLAAIQNVPDLVALFGALGLGEAALYFAAREPGTSRAVTMRALKIGLAGIALAMVVGWVVILLTLRDPELRRDATLYLLVIPPTVIYTIAYQPLRALGRVGLWVLLRLGITAGWLLCLVLAMVLDRPSALLVAMLFCVVMVVVAAVALAAAHRYPDVERPQPGLSKRLLGFGLPNALVVFPQAMNLRLDQVLLAGLVSNTELGLYTTAVGWSGVVLPFFWALAQFAMPKLAGSAAEDQAVWRRRIIRWAFGAAVVLFVVMIIPTRVLFPIVMGRQLAPGVNVAILMLAASALNGLQLVLEETCKGLGRPRRVLLAELIGLVVTIALLAVLLGPHGIVGAAWASIGGYAVVVVVMLVVMPQSK